MCHMEDKSYITLDRLTGKLGLPGAYIKELAAGKKIPSLNVNGRLRFNPQQVQAALDRMAEGGSNV